MADETFVGGKSKNRAFKPPPPKEPVFSLVERGGKVRSFHVPAVSAKTLRPILVEHADRKSYLARWRRERKKIERLAQGDGAKSKSSNPRARSRRSSGSSHRA